MLYTRIISLIVAEILQSVDVLHLLDSEGENVNEMLVS